MTHETHKTILGALTATVAAAYALAGDAPMAVLHGLIALNYLREAARGTK